MSLPYVSDLIPLTDLSGSGTSFDFGLDYEEYGVGAFAYTNQDNINISYSAKVTPISATTATPTTDITDNPTSKSFGVRMLDPKSHLWLSLVIALLKLVAF